jgi:hypothetical protein
LIYFSGFSLKDEQELFKDYIIKGDFTVCGFSYGSQKALEYVLNTTKRVDLLQLFSPAYFNDKSDKYKKFQLKAFHKDKISYGNSFFSNSGFTQNQKQYFSLGIKEELEELLYYKWDEKKLQFIVSKGIDIEVYLGLDDKIINPKKTADFFRKYCEVYAIKNLQHNLCNF